MKHLPLILVPALIAIGLCCSACAAPNTPVDTPGGPPPLEAAAPSGTQTPAGTLVEVESGPLEKDPRVVADASASGGKGIALKGDWDRISIAVPTGDAFRVWVRHRYGPVALKGTGGGAEKELRWNFNRPAAWTWSDFGVHTRAELGDTIRLMRQKQDDKPDPMVDAVVFAPDKVVPLPPFEPDAAAAPLTVRASVDWSETVGKMAPTVWGVNDYEVLSPEKAAHPGLQAYLKQVNFPIIRIHNAGFSDAWTDAKTRTWNVEKIKAGFAASTGYGDAKIMMNIASWPGWLHDGGYLPPEKTDEFVALVGRLVRIMRDEVKHPVAYWELLNEKEAGFEKAGKLDELWSLYNRLAAEVRKQDPNARVGGPAMSWPNPVWVEGFLKNCGPNADFITWHTYGTGSIYDSNEDLLKKPAGFASAATRVREAVAKYVPGRDFGTFLTEYNVKWTWTPYERRHENNVGAVFMASTLRHIGLSGISGLMHWHVKGQYYGMIDNEAKLRTPAYLYLWGTDYLIGDIARHTSGDENLELLPIVRADGARSLLLINKANRTVKVPGGAALLGSVAGGSPWTARLDATGYTAPAPLAAGDGELSLPGYSVTILSGASK